MLTLCLFMLPHHHVYASSYGSIELDFKGADISSTSFSLYKIAGWKNDMYDQFETLAKFSDLGDLNSIKTSQDYEDVIKACMIIIDDNSIAADQIQKSNSSGIVRFDDLSLGLYVIIQNKSDTKYDVESLIISVPQDKEFNVKAYPKYSFVDDVPDKPKPPDITDTSDNTVIYPYIAACFVSAIMIVVIIKLTKEETREKEL